MLMIKVFCYCYMNVNVYIVWSGNIMVRALDMMLDVMDTAVGYSTFN